MLLLGGGLCYAPAQLVELLLPLSMPSAALDYRHHHGPQPHSPATHGEMFRYRNTRFLVSFGISTICTTQKATSATLRQVQHYQVAYEGAELGIAAGEVPCQAELAQGKCLQDRRPWYSPPG